MAGKLSMTLSESTSPGNVLGTEIVSDWELIQYQDKVNPKTLNFIYLP